MSTTPNTSPNEESSLKFLLQSQDDFQIEIERLRTLTELLALSNPDDEEGRQLNQFGTLLDPVAKRFSDFVTHIDAVYKSEKTDPQKVAELWASPHADNAFAQLEAVVNLAFHITEEKMIGRFWYVLQPVLTRFAELHRSFWENLKAAQKTLKITDSFLQANSGRDRVTALKNPDPKRYRFIGIAAAGNIYEARS